MRIQPDGINLLDTVINVLREEVLPSLAPEQQYSVRMAINAIGIARRQLARGDAGEAQEQALLAELLGTGGSHAELSWLLAQRIRDGRAKDNPALRKLLWQLTLQRVAESAPRYLQQENLSLL
jgi:predicted Zn-dependent peptidase